MRISRNGVGAFALAIILVSFSASMVFAQVKLPAENHYKVYVASPVFRMQRPVTLLDQFGKFDVLDLSFDRFSTPAEKILPDGTDYPIINPVVHMDWWRISSHQASHTVIGTDQFGAGQWVLGDAVYLLTPSLKNVTPDPRGGPPPPVWNHYVCYDAISGPLVNRPVTLIDQFGNVQVVVLAAKYFCNPAEKHDGLNVYPIIDKGAHLACYSVDNPLPEVYAITTIDQFGFWKTSIMQNDCLCVPAFMDTPVPTRESTWGRIKALYRN